MADVHSKEKRSYNMSRIRSKNTKPEERVRKYLFSQGFRYRKNDPKLPGKPDIVLPKYKTAIFINGCFWHCHEGCKYFKYPQSNDAFWREKLSANQVRDQHQMASLKEMGIHVIVVWECELKQHKMEKRLTDLVEEIKSYLPEIK